MEKQKTKFSRKIVIALLIVAVCGIVLFAYLSYITRGEGDSYFVFTEVSVNETANSSIIHLTDKDIFNLRGIDVVQQDGKISRVRFRSSEPNPARQFWAFNQEYGSRPGNISERKFLEFRGVFYYAEPSIP
jgi:hypothetical protein